MWGKQSSKRKFELGIVVMSLPKKGSKTFKRGSSPTSTCEMDYCGISKIGFMSQKGGQGMWFWRNAWWLQAMVVQSTTPHSSIGPTWKRMRKNTWRLAWLVNKTEYSIRSKWDCFNHYPFSKGHGKVSPWISWWVCHHQRWRIPNSFKDPNVGPSRKQRKREESGHAP